MPEPYDPNRDGERRKKENIKEREKWAARQRIVRQAVKEELDAREKARLEAEESESKSVLEW